MANQEKPLFLADLKNSLESFFFAARRLSKSILAPLGPTSEPSIAVDEEQLDRLRAKLRRVSAVLRDAERLTDAGESAKLWRRELRDVECGLEDILEKVQFESLRASLVEDLCAGDGDGTERAKNPAARDREVGALLSHSPLSSLGLKIKKIWEKYYEIASDREALRLTPEDGAARSNFCARTPSSSLVTSELYGREGDLKRLRELLCSEDCSGREYMVVSIVGMGGVGKTTIVQHVYNDQGVKDLFDYRAWICAGQGIDVVSMTKTMVQACGGDTRDMTELSLLQGLLVDILKGKRFLLVLDEIWSMEGDAWDRLKGPLSFVLRGSRVVVTSRNAEVANIMGCDPRHRLNLNYLSDASCWLICKNRAYHGQDLEMCPELALISEKIVKRCKGLPLAAKVVGGLLRSMINEEKWCEVLYSDVWANDELVNEILPALRLSYDHLPVHLKNCFVYCSLFPKGYIFDKEELIRLWMAQGFIECHVSLQPEDVGRKYFDDLVGRCFFQQSPFYDIIEGRYEMHDLFHELAQSIAEKECARIEDYKYINRHDTIDHENIRHSSLVPSLSIPEITIEGQLFHGQDLRTLLVIENPYNETDDNFVHVRIPYDLFLILECLRALDLSNTSISELPGSIGNLIHLRYLGLKSTKVKRLPESVCGLLNLQTLDLRDSYCLNELPWGIRYLINLRHLELPLSDYPTISIPSELGLLSGLQTLNAFSVTNNSADCGIDGLRDLVNLSGELHISGLMNVCHAQDAENANMHSKEKLQKLVLKWWSLTATRSRHQDAQTPYMVLARLQPHPNLKELTISGYCGSKFPTWLGDCYFVKLVKLILEGCENCDVLPPLGQLPCLKHLTIKQMEKVRNVGREFIGQRSKQTHGFPALETLVLRKLYALEKWYGVEEGDFPCLQDVTVTGCSKLNMLPQFGCLINLRIQCCEQLHDLPIFPRLKYLKLEGFEKVMQLPQLPKLPLLEILEVSCCNHLSSVGNLEHLVALQWLKITKCPLLQFSFDEPLPSMLKAVLVFDGCHLQSKWSPRGYERSTFHDKNPELVEMRETIK